MGLALGTTSVRSPLAPPPCTTITILNTPCVVPIACVDPLHAGNDPTVLPHRQDGGAAGHPIVDTLILYDNQILTVNIPASLSGLAYQDMSYNLVKSKRCPLLDEVRSMYVQSFVFVANV